MTSQSFWVSCFWSCGFVPHRKWNLTLLVHQNTGKENRYQKIVLLYLSLHWGDLIEQIKKDLSYTLKVIISDWCIDWLDIVLSYVQCLILHCVTLSYKRVNYSVAKELVTVLCCVTKELIINYYIAQFIRTCLEQTACIKRTLVRVQRVSLKYRFHCTIVMKMNFFSSVFK